MFLSNIKLWRKSSYGTLGVTRVYGDDDIFSHVCSSGVHFFTIGRYAVGQLAHSYAGIHSIKKFK